MSRGATGRIRNTSLMVASRVMEDVGDGPFQHCGGCLHTGSKDVPHSHEEVVLTEANRLCADLCCVVVVGAAFGPQERVQQVPLHLVTVVRLVNGHNTHHNHHQSIVVSRGHRVESSYHVLLLKHEKFVSDGDTLLQKTQEELKHSEQTTLVTARVSSGDRSRASPAAAASDRTEHRDPAWAWTEKDTAHTPSHKEQTQTHTFTMLTDFFGVRVLVDHDDTVGAQHQRVGLSVFLLQLFKKHMRGVRAPQTEQTTDQRQCWEMRGLLGAIGDVIALTRQVLKGSRSQEVKPREGCNHLLGQAARNMVIQEDAILHSEDTSICEDRSSYTVTDRCAGCREETGPTPSGPCHASYADSAASPPLYCSSSSSLLLLLLLIIILIVAVCDLLWGLREEVGGLDLTDGSSQLVPFVLHPFEVHIVPVACCQRRLGVHDADVAEGVVQQVDEGGGVKVSVAHHLRGKQRLSGSTAEQTSHHAVAHLLSVHTCSSWASSGITRKVLQP
ncbi:hypothetical protein F7725_024546 [Dissostichus mawsoni]|uniref:BLOC-1-related complex subunit 7 n=1 Tax=Dissostichus mawsoni TaxID=36200 RepID=A0A7J5XZL4_DISMA|nr:hypothetical protein F7725_024546 [Dissostichus mawsoni]